MFSIAIFYTTTMKTLQPHKKHFIFPGGHYRTTPAFTRNEKLCTYTCVHETLEAEVEKAELAKVFST